MSVAGSPTLKQGHVTALIKQQDSKPPHELMRDIYQDMRISTSMAAGLEAMAHKALDDGEASMETIEHLANIASRLRHELAESALALAELNGRQ